MQRATYMDNVPVHSRLMPQQQGFGEPSKGPGKKRKRRRDYSLRAASTTHKTASHEGQLGAMAAMTLGTSNLSIEQPALGALRTLVTDFCNAGQYAWAESFLAQMQSLAESKAEALQANCAEIEGLKEANKSLFLEVERKDLHIAGVTFMRTQEQAARDKLVEQCNAAEAALFSAEEAHENSRKECEKLQHEVETVRMELAAALDKADKSEECLVRETVAKNALTVRLRASKAECVAAKQRLTELELEVGRARKITEERTQAAATLEEHASDLSHQLVIISNKLGIKSAKPPSIRQAIVTLQSTLEDRREQLEREREDNEKLLQEQRAEFRRSKEQKQLIGELKASLKAQKERTGRRDLALGVAVADVSRLNATVAWLEVEKGVLKKEVEALKKEGLQRGLRERSEERLEVGLEEGWEEGLEEGEVDISQEPHEQQNTGFDLRGQPGIEEKAYQCGAGSELDGAEVLRLEVQFVEGEKGSPHQSRLRSEVHVDPHQMERQGLKMESHFVEREDRKRRRVSDVEGGTDSDIRTPSPLKTETDKQTEEWVSPLMDKGDSERSGQRQDKFQWKEVTDVKKGGRLTPQSQVGLHNESNKQEAPEKDGHKRGLFLEERENMEALKKEVEDAREALQLERQKTKALEEELEAAMDGWQSLKLEKEEREGLEEELGAELQSERERKESLQKELDAAREGASLELAAKALELQNEGEMRKDMEGKLEAYKASQVSVP